MAHKLTPSQTIGPFFHFALAWEGAHRLLDEAAPDAVRIEGRVLDGDGVPVPDALVEVWQADAAGRYRHPEDPREPKPDDTFVGFGRCATDDDGVYRFVTVKPGRVPGRGNALQAPHLNVAIFARGLLKHLFTRIYFADEPEANAEDPVLNAIEDEAARTTLVAERVSTALETGGGPPVYRFDLHLQGQHETAFFDP